MKFVHVIQSLSIGIIRARENKFVVAANNYVFFRLFLLQYLLYSRFIFVMRSKLYKKVKQEENPML